MKRILISLSIVMSLTGCEKVIDIDMPEYEKKIMIEGWIADGQNPMVVLTYNFEYTKQAGTELYENSFIHDATIVIKDEEGDSVMLSELPVYDAEYDYTAYIYTAQYMSGEWGNSYNLFVQTEGQVFEATTYIPKPVPILDIWQEPHPDSDIDSMNIVKCRIKDPAGSNYYRYLYRINGEDGASPELSTLNDSYFDGKEYVKAIDSGLDNEEEDIHGGIAGYFYTGDTIEVNWINSEKSYYDFWTTVDFRRTTSMSPFSSPTRVVGNIEGALGYWSGLGVSTAEIVIE